MGRFNRFTTGQGTAPARAHIQPLNFWGIGGSRGISDKVSSFLGNILSLPTPPEGVRNAFQPAGLQNSSLNFVPAAWGAAARGGARRGAERGRAAQPAAATEQGLSTIEP